MCHRKLSLFLNINIFINQTRFLAKATSSISPAYHAPNASLTSHLARAVPDQPLDARAAPPLPAPPLLLPARQHARRLAPALGVLLPRQRAAPPLLLLFSQRHTLSMHTLAINRSPPLPHHRLPHRPRQPPPWLPPRAPRLAPRLPRARLLLVPALLRAHQPLQVHALPWRVRLAGDDSLPISIMN